MKQNKNEIKEICKTCGHKIGYIDLIRKEFSCLIDDCKCKECHTWNIDNLNSERKEYYLSRIGQWEEVRAVERKESSKQIKKKIRDKRDDLIKIVWRNILGVGTFDDACSIVDEIIKDLLKEG